MSSRRKPLETNLFRPKEEIEQEAQSPSTRDMSPGAVDDEPRLKRASFDLREEQIKGLGMLKYQTGKKISELAQEAIDDLLAKYG